jgi:hypothetical protein
MGAGRWGCNVGDGVTGTGGPADDRVVLEVPGDPVFLRLLRIAAADAATRLDFDIDRLECARLVVDELAGVLMSLCPGVRLSVTLRSAWGDLVVEGSVAVSRPVQAVADRFVQELLDAAIGPDQWALAEVDGTVGFSAWVAGKR